MDCENSLAVRNLSVDSLSLGLMRRPRPTDSTPAAALAVSLVALLAVRPSDAQSVGGNDPAQRGLDVFVHVPERAAPREKLPLQIEVFGFPSVVSLVPLGSAAVEVAWDPESLGPGISEAPPSVRATTDAGGRAHLDIPVPDGDVRELKLLIGVRSGAHERTRTVSIQRGRAQELSLHVADAHVVPGSSVSSWVMLTSAATGAPVSGETVELRLLEGGYTRHRMTLVTDAAGTAMARVPIPRTNEPTWAWQLEARTLARRDQGARAERSVATGTLTLTPREETPGSPWVSVRWAHASVLAGDRVPFRVSVRDATDQPIAALPVRYWIGPKGTEPPKDDKAWEKASTRAITDAKGEVSSDTVVPTTVVQSVGTTVRVVVKTNVEGHDLHDSATVSVGVPVSSAELRPEGTSIVPGLEQRMLLRVYDGHGRPVAAPFSVEGDGLKASVTTDADGEAEVTWRAPVDLGALRNVGPCAGGVAAAVVVRPVVDVPALHPRSSPFELCVPIDRDATGLIRVDRPIAKVGDRVRVRVIEATGSKDKEPAAKRPWSVVLRSGNGEQAASLWLDDGDKGGEIEVPSAAGGAWSLSAASPGSSPSRKARVVGGALLVTPKILPALVAKVGGGRAAPGGAVEIDADLSDGHGRGLPGTVAAVVIDLHGGGGTAGLTSLDTRRSLCEGLAIDAGRCDRFVEGDPALDPLRRGALSGAGVALLKPRNDPAANAEEALSKAFSVVLHSLEGAVFEAARSADQLRDVRRKGPGGWAFNPELMTLVTAAMENPPETPGGEALSLTDLLAVDPQVTFNNVARRITRLKLFRILAEVRTFRHEKDLDPDEPMFKNPNALLRRLVHDGRLAEDLLLDPWGGTIQFTASSGPPIPFLSVIRGFELHSPGPDGVVGNGDDVRDPFERVIRSGTPYAKAMSEDRIVDAKFDLEVGDATVAAWTTLFQELTGTAIGDAFGAGGIGLSGVGEGGGGRGEGIGLGSVGTIGHGRGSAGVESGVAFWSVPQRTDPGGHVRFHIPLGDAETTWRVALVAVPDGARPATTSVDVPVALPLSARVDVGATWVEGDRVTAAVTLRNRTEQAIRATLEAMAGGAGRIDDPREASQSIEVPAGGVATATVGLRAPSPGEGSLTVKVRAPGLPDDVLTHRWQVLAAGEPTDLTRSQWVSEDTPAELGVTLDTRAMRLVGKPRLLLTRGFEEALRGALDALDPDGLRSPEALVEAVEVAARVERWAIGREGDGSALAVRAAEMRDRALGRLSVYRKAVELPWPSVRRAFAWSPAASRSAAPLKEESSCPSEGPFSIEDRLSGLDAEPGPNGGAALACWDAFVSDAIDQVQRSTDPVMLARAVLSLSERPHRAATAASLIDKLRERVELRATGRITLSSFFAASRAARATVFAALLRGVRLGRPSVASAERLEAWLAVQRDVEGGYGSPLATRSVVRALLSSGNDAKGASVATVIAGGVARDVEVGPSGRVLVPLDAAATGVKVTVRGPGVIARLERPVLRLWSRPPDEVESPVHVDITWPKEPKAGKTGVLRVNARHGLGREATLDLRISLPPGVSLAEAVSGVSQMQGMLMVRKPLGVSDLPTSIEIPVRFGLRGQVTVPEARAAIAYEEVQRTLAPARPLVIR